MASIFFFVRHQTPQYKHHGFTIITEPHHYEQHNTLTPWSTVLPGKVKVPQIAEIPCTLWNLKAHYHIQPEPDNYPQTD